MSNDQFRRAEEEFFRLKGQLATGRITQAQFQAALKQLMIQDAQGRWWMLGLDTGKWYVHEGATWVEANPGIAPPPSPAASYWRAAASVSRQNASKSSGSTRGGLYARNSSSDKSKQAISPPKMKNVFAHIKPQFCRLRN